MTGNVAGVPASRATALDYMERALAILRTLDGNSAKSVEHLVEAIDAAMPAPLAKMTADETELTWQMSYVAQRVFQLHNKYEMTFEQIAQRLGITADQAREHLDYVEMVINAPPPTKDV